MAKIVFNTSGSAHVGSQIGQVRGDVNVGVNPMADIRAEVAELRQALFAALGTGELDRARFAAAERQLEEIDTHLDDANSSSGRKKLIDALTRLKELAPGATDLGAKIATIIAAVHGLL
jgi:hypothetical protein